MRIQFLDRLLSATVARKRTIGPLPADNWFWMPSRLLAEQSSSVNYPYKESGWVYASIKTISENIARLPFKLYQGSEDDPNVIETGPMYDLFLNPNPFMTQEILLEATFIFLGLRGEAFWILDRSNVTEIPTAIWTFDPARFSPIWDKDRKNLMGWKYTAGPNNEFVFSLDEIIHFKYFNPYDDLRGLAPLESIKIAIDYDYYADVFNRQYFKDGVRVSGFITVPEGMDDDEYNRLDAQINEKHAGYTKAHKIAIITGGGVFTEARINQKDMDFINLKKITREIIFGVYKTNAVVMGLYEDIQSYEGVKTAHKMFWEECLQPKIYYFENLLWAKFFSKIKGGKVWGAFDLANVEAMHDFYAAKLASAEIMTKIGWTANSINKRLQLGMGDTPWGDAWWAPMGLRPITSIEDGQPPEPEPVDSGNDSDEDDTKTPPKKPTKDEELYSTLWSRFISKQSPLEDLMKSKLSRWIFDQRKSVLAAVFAGKRDRVFDREEEGKKLAKIFFVFYPMCLKIGSETIQEELGNLPGYEFDIQLPETLSYFDMRMRKIPNEIATRIGNQIAKILEDNKEEKVEVIAYKIRELYNKIGKRVSTVARTESSAVINMGRVLQMQRQGVRYHKWISSRNEKSRETHRGLEGKVVKLGESFLKDQLLRWPCDMSGQPEMIINCLCFTIPEKG